MKKYNPLRMYLIQKRNSKGISISKMALLLDVSKTYYYSLERGARGNALTVRLMAKIAEVLDANVEELVQSEIDYINEKELDEENWIGD